MNNLILALTAFATIGVSVFGAYVALQATLQAAGRLGRTGWLHVEPARVLAASLTPAARRSLAANLRAARKNAVERRFHRF